MLIFCNNKRFFIVGAYVVLPRKASNVALKKNSPKKKVRNNDIKLANNNKKIFFE